MPGEPSKTMWHQLNAREAVASGRKMTPRLSRLIKEDVSQLPKAEVPSAQQTGMTDKERVLSRPKEQPVPGHRDMRGHGTFGQWQTTRLKVGSAEQQSAQLTRQGPELTLYCTVNRWRILIRKVTLPKFHVRKIIQTTAQTAKLKGGQPIRRSRRQEPGRQIEGCLVVKVRDSELASSWHSTMALADTAQGHYVRTQRHWFF